MIVTLLILSFLFLVYTALLLFYWAGWRRIPTFQGNRILVNDRISIIIPARNEEQNIDNLLNCLKEQSYPEEQMEIIVVDDHSTDQTASKAGMFPGVRVISLQEDNINSYKKKAIEKGIAAATADWIITTDADCLPPAEWVATLVAFRHQCDAVFVAAPVLMNNDDTTLQTFQSMDFMMLQGITGTAVHNKHLSMCNGANILYSKNAFHEVGGFTGIDNIASGDDMLLMHKIAKRYPERVRYLKSQSVIVPTAPMTTWKDFFNQRIRWASKAVQYDDKRFLPVLLLVYIFNLAFPVLMVAGFWDTYYWMILAGLLVLKTTMEWPLFAEVSSFFSKKWNFLTFLIYQPLHIVYTVVSGFLGQTGKYEWKGRRVK